MNTYDQAETRNWIENARYYYENYKQRGRGPKDHYWRPVSFATNDHVLGMLTVRLNRKTNLLEVDDCILHDIFPYPPLTSTRIALAFIFSDAFRCGGSMEIRFTENVEGGKVPLGIFALAQQYGIALKFADEGAITQQEAVQLYLKVSEFSPQAESKIIELDVSNKVSVERVCYLVNHGYWSLEEAETILLGSDYPEMIFKKVPDIGTQQLLYDMSLTLARNAILGGNLDRILRSKEVKVDDNSVETPEGIRRDVDIDFDPEFFSKVYTINERTPLRWVHPSSHHKILQKGEKLRVLVRGRTVGHQTLFMDRDLESAKILDRHYRKDSNTHLAMLVGGDFNEIPKASQNKMIDSLNSSFVSLLVCPQPSFYTDEEVRKRFKAIDRMRP